ncbi:hypothetical protein MLD38_020159 [Melastoma candidum]|uniref:Uncharacterized protein n=1 Tax=Melastoma candidum TaxID=119954 RepID=A0ACB9QK24_9MYRT|nr:hypothetical protein MLD38_020159 [Melastoma candidum]
MEKSEREIHDFMNVESFSQLPFIRSAPREKPTAAGIRLFGIKFDTPDDPSGPSSMSKPDRETFKAASANSEANGNGNNVDSSRRFECNYCCRNFPTSQALGGHQNAHKRERQHAKQANLQSALVAHSGLSDMYRFGVYGTSSATYNSHPQWGYSSGHYYGGTANNTNSNISNSYYGGAAFSHHAHNHWQPINSNPLRRIPATAIAQTTSQEPLPLLGRDAADKPGRLGQAVEGMYAREAKAGMQEPVSLDLHL